jgi:ankyrin repeat protein
MDDGATPLYSAAFMGWVDVVRVLLREGADPIKVNIVGMSPLDAARQGGHVAIVDLIEEVVSGNFP